MTPDRTSCRLSVSTPLGDDALLLRSLEGEESISSLFRFQLQMVSEQTDLDFAAIVGQPATVTIEAADGAKRYVNGIVGRFVQAGRDDTYADYHAELHPWLWLLTMSADCRIFQDLSTPEILAAVFDELGFTDYANRLTAGYASREFCVQYNESAFDFVSRLLEEEGIHYFFEHADGQHTLVLADDASCWREIPGAATVDYSPSDAGRPAGAVTGCSFEQGVIAGRFALDDFNFETPSTDLMSSVEGGGQGCASRTCRARRRSTCGPSAT